MPNKSEDLFLTKQKQLLDFLVTKALIKPDAVNTLLADITSSGKTADELLVSSNLLKAEDLIKAKAEFLTMAYANLSFVEVPEDILNSIPAEIAENYQVVCFAKEANKLSVGLTDPDNFRAMEALSFLAKKNNWQIEYSLISSISFTNVFRQYKKFGKEISSALKTKEQEDAASNAESKTIEDDDESFETMVKNAPVAKIVHEIIKHAVEAGASDIHIEPLEKESRVRYRIDGILHSSLSLPKTIHDSIVARIKVLARLKLDETRVPQGGRIRLTIEDKDVDFRVSCLPLMGEEKVVMRVLDTTKGVLTLEQLGFAASSMDLVKKNIDKTVGIILVTGPTGSGKSTTLYSIMHMLNNEGVNIVTLEDPVEYFIHGINQSQIRPDIGFTFAAGLRSLLRQDPDIMMVGEIRDNETAELAIHAALTGHLVMSTLHTNDAIGAIPRLIDMKIEPFLLSSVMDLIVAQRLARRLCQYCKREKAMPEEVVTDVKAKLSKIKPEILARYLPDYGQKPMMFYEPVGCDRCNKTGYKGRVALIEALDVNDFIRESILKDNGHITIEMARENQDFITINEDGLIKALQGATSLEEVMRVMNE
jgi:type IV pilus assembly protein PilB